MGILNVKNCRKCPFLYTETDWECIIPNFSYCRLLGFKKEKSLIAKWYDDQEPKELFTVLPNCPLKDGALTIELKSNPKNENKSD